MSLRESSSIYRINIIRYTALIRIRGYHHSKQFDSASILRIGLTRMQVVRKHSLKENLTNWTTELFFRMASSSLFTRWRAQSLMHPPTVLLNMSALCAATGDP